MIGGAPRAGAEPARAGAGSFGAGALAPAPNDTTAWGPAFESALAALIGAIPTGVPPVHVPAPSNAGAGDPRGVGVEACGPRGPAVEATTIREPDLDARGLRAGLAEPGGATVDFKADVHMAWSGSREVLPSPPTHPPDGVQPVPMETAPPVRAVAELTVPEAAAPLPHGGTTATRSAGRAPRGDTTPGTTAAPPAEALAGALEALEAVSPGPAQAAPGPEPAPAEAREPGREAARAGDVAPAQATPADGAREGAASDGAGGGADRGAGADPGPADAGWRAAEAPAPEAAEPAEPAPRPEPPPALTRIPEERTVRVAVDADLAVEVSTFAEGVVDVTVEGAGVSELGDLGPSLRDALALGGWTLGTYQPADPDRPRSAKRVTAQEAAADAAPARPAARRGHLLDLEA